MKSKLILYITMVGLIGLLFSCKKDGTNVVILTNPVKPTLSALPALTLQRTHSSDTLVFVGTPVDPGFKASANYYLEACASGNNFVDVISILHDIQDASLKITVSDLDNKLLAKLPADQVSSVDFRIRAVLAVDAGTGAPGTSTNPMQYSSDIKTASVTTFGPPTLALTTAGTVQGIISPADNGKYAGWIYTDGTPFHFTNKDNGKVYGGDASSGVLTENGPDITLEAGGYNLTADLTNLSNITWTHVDVTIGIIGDAVGGWADDTKMVYDFSDGSWNITKSVVSGGIKFRAHGVWNSVNIGYRPNDKNLNNLYQSHGLLNGVQLEPDLGDSGNIDDIAAGNYNIKLFEQANPWKASAVFTPAK